VQVVASLVKQRRDSIEQFTRGGRADLAAKEAREIQILDAYLPPAMDPAALEVLVSDTIAELGAVSARDIGRVMKGVMAKVAARRGREGRQRPGPAQARRMSSIPARGSAGPPTSSSGSRLARSAGVIGLATMASRLLGLAREQVLAFYFGAGNAMDAFNIAFRIPNLLRDLFAEGAMSAAFVPTFTQQLQNGKPRAWQLGNHVVNTLLVVTIPLVCSMVFADPLVRLC
jgi:hypothetical protein